MSSGYGGLAEKRLMAWMAASGGYTGGTLAVLAAAAAAGVGAVEDLVREATWWRLRAAARSDGSFKCRSCSQGSTERTLSTFQHQHVHPTIHGSKMLHCSHTQ